VTAQITAKMVGSAWRLELLAGQRMVKLSRAELLAMTQSSYDLPIACVEGWTTTQHWTGVPISDLAAVVGVHGSFTANTRSLATNGAYDYATLASEQTSDQRTMLALKVNGGDLSLDHGFPARVIGPAIPGVHCTKWAREMIFKEV
jgi:DMSO/TMAO reductase YedYZ molybdopterin-dependent catalytic subunit